MTVAMLFSYSRLKLYETCPRRFYFKYILGWMEPVTPPLALGKAVHRGIEALINGLDVQNAIMEGYAACDFHPEISLNELSRLVKRAPVAKNMGETEVYFRLPLFHSPNAPEIQGYIDLVQKGKLVDWKTNWRPFHVLANEQPALYAWALSRLQKTNLVEGSLYFLRHKKESKHFFDTAEMEKARKWAAGLADEILKRLELLDFLPEMAGDIFPYRPSHACSHCPFTIKCHEDLKTKRGVDIIANPGKRD